MTRTGINTLGLGGSGSHGNENVLYILQRSLELKSHNQMQLCHIQDTNVLEIISVNLKHVE